MSTLLVSTLIIGIAVDDTIHFMHQFDRSYAASGDVEGAVRATLGSTGSALFVTSLVLAGMLAPRNLGRDYTEAFDAVFPALADKHEAAFYPFFLDGVALNPALNQSDGIHPNAAGVRQIVEGIAPRVIAVIESLDR